MILSTQIFSYFFPKIFGGGKAFLELTDNDLLNTGVNIMAKPPGKLVKNLNLLSGGEKAGTGIAFVSRSFASILHHSVY